MSGNWRQGGQRGQRSNNWHNQKAGGSKRKYESSLTPGDQGFLCTCDGKFRQRDCVRDAYNILNEYANARFGEEVNNWRKPAQSDGKEQTEDVDESLEEEIAALKRQADAPPAMRRFQSVECDINGIVFIKTSLKNPCEIAHDIVSNIAETQSQKSKFLMRFIPVEVTCRATMEEIKKSAEPLLKQYFQDGDKTFSIVFSHKYNDTIKRDEIIDKFATDIVAINPTNKVNLTTPQLAVIVDVLRKVCCISVVPDYLKYKKYNILELSAPKQPAGPEDAKNSEVEKSTGVASDETEDQDKVIETDSVDDAQANGVVEATKEVKTNEL